MLSHLHKEELFLFPRLYPKEVDHKKTARFSGNLFLKIVSGMCFHLIHSLDTHDDADWYSGPDSLSPGTAAALGLLLIMVEKRVEVRYSV